MPILDNCATLTGSTILSGTNCSIGGLQAIFYALKDDIDWTATTWDDSAKTITAFTMQSGKVFYEITFNPDTAIRNSTQQNQIAWQNDVTIDILGQSAATALQLNKLQLQGCGKVVVVTVDNNCNLRLLGMTRNRANDGFITVYDPLQFVDGVDTSGTVSDKARDSITMRCFSRERPLYLDMSLSGIPTS